MITLTMLVHRGSMNRTLIPILTLIVLPAAAVDLAGTWRFEQTANNRRKRMTTYVFRKDGNKFTGDFDTLTERREILNGSIDGAKITVHTRVEFDEAGGPTPFDGDMNG